MKKHLEFLDECSDIRVNYVKENLENYHEVAKNSMDKVGCCGGFICDASQRPASRNRSGAWLPTLQTTSILAKLDLNDPAGDQLITPRELLFSHGFPTFKKYSGSKLAALIGPKYKQFSLNTHQTTLGGGMHLAAEAAWFLYVASHTVRRDCLSIMEPHLWHSRIVFPKFHDSHDASDEQEDSDMEVVDVFDAKA